MNSLLCSFLLIATLLGNVESAASSHSPYTRGITCGSHIASDGRSWVDHCPANTACVYVDSRNGWNCVDSAEQCRDYAKLWETNKCTQDGASNYLRDYGFRYCNRFFRNFSSFNEDGQKFVSCSAKCLLKKMSEEILPAIRDSSTSRVDCTLLRDRAYASHVDCYTECQVCSALTSWRNINAYWRVIDVKDLEAGPVVAIAGKCAEKVLTTAYEWMQQWPGQLMLTLTPSG